MAEDVARSVNCMPIKPWSPGFDPKHPLNKGAKCLPAISDPERQGQVRNPRSSLAAV